MIQRCSCTTCQKESEHGRGFVWENTDGTWVKSYSIAPPSKIRFGYPHGIGSSFRPSGCAGKSKKGV